MPDANDISVADDATLGAIMTDCAGRQKIVISGKDQG
jgi:hypothetical protein